MSDVKQLTRSELEAGLDQLNVMNARVVQAGQIRQDDITRRRSRDG